MGHYLGLSKSVHSGVTIKQGSAAHIIPFTSRKMVKRLYSYDFVRLSFSVPIVSIIKQHLFVELETVKCH